MSHHSNFAGGLFQDSQDWQQYITEHSIQVFRLKYTSHQIFRFGDQRNLSFAMPENSWMFSFKEPFKESMISESKLGYDLFVFHRLVSLIAQFTPVWPHIEI